MKLSKRQPDHPYLDIMAIIFIVVVIIGSILGYVRFQETQKARIAFAQKQKNLARTITEFDLLMKAREQFLAIAARSDATLVGISAKVNESISQKDTWNKEASAMQDSYNSEVAAIKAHNDAENAKYKADPRYTTRDYWTIPTSPGSPASLSLDFSAETAALAANKEEVGAFLAQLKGSEGDYKSDANKAIFKDLYRSANALDSALKRNVEIVGGLVATGKEGQIVNEAKAGLIKHDAEDEWLKALRIKAQDFIKENKLSLVDYDLPGGVDLNPSDKSTI